MMNLLLASIAESMPGAGTPPGSGVDIPTLMAGAEGAYFDFASASKFQDVEGATPVTADGQTILRVESQFKFSTINRHLSIPSGGPVWEASTLSLNYGSGNLALSHNTVPSDVTQTFAPGLSHTYMARIFVPSSLAAFEAVFGGSLSATWRSAGFLLSSGAWTGSVGNDGTAAIADPTPEDLRNSWRVVALTHNDTTAELWVDGIKTESHVLSGGTWEGGRATGLGYRVTGLNQTSGDNFFSGKISHYLSTRKVLSDAEILDTATKWAA